jgi:pyruvate kinase
MKDHLMFPTNSTQIDEVDTLLDSLVQLRDKANQRAEQLLTRWQPKIKRTAFSDGAHNLAHYLALREHDLRALQISLMPWGLASMGHIESHVEEGLNAIIDTLEALHHGTPRLQPNYNHYFVGEQQLNSETQRVLGPTPPNRRVQIMVTLPSEAADHGDLVYELMVAGMTCARINCAHDDVKTWERMVGFIRQAELTLGTQCRVLMDLAGPKVRTQSVSQKKHVFQLHETLLLSYGDIQRHNKHYPYQVSCSLPEVIRQVEVGHKVWFDDGTIGACVEHIIPEGLVLTITDIRKAGRKLKPEKGINFPDTMIQIKALTAKDRHDLDFAAHHADMIGYSFVQSADDVVVLQEELVKRLGADASKKAIIAKIETRMAVSNLPEIIVQAAGQNPLGVMIARGDLAVEIGFDRLAEIQEEILWLCEAARIPVIWATQVFESLVKEGMPSRAEVTDAAMAQRAECVMLNKGDFILKGVTTLDTILTRMGAHQFKRTASLRALQSWQSLS